MIEVREFEQAGGDADDFVFTSHPNLPLSMRSIFESEWFQKAGGEKYFDSAASRFWSRQYIDDIKEANGDGFELRQPLGRAADGAAAKNDWLTHVGAGNLQRANAFRAWPGERTRGIPEQPFVVVSIVAGDSTARPKTVIISGWRCDDERMVMMETTTETEQ